MKIKTAQPTAKHLAYRKALTDALEKFKDELRADEMLAVTAHLVGQIIAVQDQRAMTPSMAMQIVSQNIEAGNRSVLDGLESQGGNA